MNNATPTALLIWAMLSCLFLIYLLYHLWAYDKFRCLSWNSGRQPGAFKRVMTYSYCVTIPLLVVFSIGVTFLKYKEGYILVPLPQPDTIVEGPLLPPGVSIGQSFPKPVEMWTASHKHLLLAMYFVFSVAWALEQVTHFEELAFWLFLLDQKTEKRDWFESWEYRLWYTSCVGAILGMPLTTLIARNDIRTTDAWTFLVGSSMSTFTNICFLYVLFRFPAFLRHVKEEGASPDVVVRLSLFYELNLVRVVFRFAVCFPLLVLAIDGITGTHIVNSNPFWVDCLLMTAALGEFVSSAMTLMIFFPRSVAKDAGYRHKVPSGTTLSQDLPMQTHSYASSYYPPGMQSPRSPAYAPSTPAAYSPSAPYPSPGPASSYPPSEPISPSAPGYTQQHQRQITPPFLLRSTRSRGESQVTSPGVLTPATVQSSRASFTSTQDNNGRRSEEEGDEDDDDEEVPEYEEPTPGNNAYAMRTRRRRSISKGVEFDVPEGLDTDGPREARQELAQAQAGPSGLRRRESQLHPYVTSFTSPIDLVGEPARATIPGRMA